MKLISARKATQRKDENIMSISQKRLEEILNIADDVIDTSNIPELSDRFWENAKMVTHITKKTVSIRLDNDIFDWFKHLEKGYQSITNNVPCTYVSHQQNKT